MGLLDSLMGSSIDDPKTMGLLQLASSLSSGQKFMPALSEGLLGRAQILSSAERQKAAQQMQQMQLQQAQRQIAQQQAQDQFRASIPSPQMQAAQGALAGGGGPTMANAQRMQPVDPMAQMRHGAMQVGLGDPMEYLASLQPKPRKLMNVAAGASVIDEATGQPVYTAPKEQPQPAALQEYAFAKQQGYGGSFLDFQLAQKRAGATNVNVPINTGQKGLDNTLKLRGDFRSEPIYKAHQEMQSAYSQIQQSLKQASPAGDLAGATKLMKLLDPGSVVRESELGMAMAASGLLDRVQNYAGNVISGNKLTPAQRKDFQTLADALFQESVKQYNGKRGEYQGIAQRNGLNVMDVLGNEAQSGTSNIDDLLKKYGGR
jgi:hypothetical protein